MRRGILALAADAIEHGDLGGGLLDDDIFELRQAQFALDQAAIGLAVGDIDRAGNGRVDRIAACQPGIGHFDMDQHGEFLRGGQADPAIAFHRAFAGTAGEAGQFQAVIGETAVKRDIGDARADTFIVIGQAGGLDHPIEVRVIELARHIGGQGHGAGKLLTGQAGEREGHAGGAIIAHAAADAGAVDVGDPVATICRRQRDLCTADHRAGLPDDGVGIVIGLAAIRIKLGIDCDIDRRGNHGGAGA